MTKADHENVVVLDQVPYICYPIWFKKSKVQVQALIDSGSKVNTMTLEYTLKLGLKVHTTDVKTKKIDGSTLGTFGIILASFQVEDKLGRI